LRYSGIPFRETVEKFDFSIQTSIDRNIINELLALRFINNKESVVFLGQLGVGKTHPSLTIAMQGIYSGIMTYYIPTIKLIQVLKKNFSERRPN